MDMSNTSKILAPFTYNAFFNLMQSQTQGRFIQDFKKLQTDEQRVNEILSLIIKHKLTPSCQVNRKDAKKSQELREQGNKIFIANPLTSVKCLEAFRLYSKAIACAPSSSLELALAYANRSAILLRTRKYVECIADIERAFKLDYPDKLCGKLHLRRLECFRVLNRATFEDFVTKMQNWMQQIKLDDKALIEFNNKLQTIIKHAETFLATTNNEIPDKIMTLSLPSLARVNKESPCASDALEIRCSDQFGRHIVATRNIDAGEVIVVEKPYSSIVNFGMLQTYCFHCTKLCWANIPCKTCSHVMYCSEECRTNDWKASHDIECLILPYVQPPNFSKLDLLAVRTVIYAIKRTGGIDKLKTEVQDIENQTDLRTKGFSPDGVFRSTEYRSVHSLVTNAEKRTVQDVLGKSFDTAAILSFFLNHTNEICDNKDFNFLNADHLRFVGGLIMRLQQIIPTNGHNMHQINGLDHMEYGSMLLPFASLVNHSCDPNVSRHYILGHSILRAIYPIQKGEQIFDNYGQHYALSPKEVRQNALMKQYHFSCNCVACKQDWPLFHNIKSYECFITDNKIRKKISDIEKNLTRCFNLVSDPHIDAQKALQLESDLRKMICVLCKHLQRPCREINYAVETLHRTYDIQAGCFDISIAENTLI